MKKILLPAVMASSALFAAAPVHAAPPAGQDAFAGAQVRVDVGGRKLNMYCLGKGSPTVLFEADAGRAGWDWSAVMPQAAARTRACVYDRAGMGASARHTAAPPARRSPRQRAPAAPRSWRS